MASWWRSAKTSGSNSALLRNRQASQDKNARDECEHAGDATARRDKALDFPRLSEFFGRHSYNWTENSHWAKENRASRSNIAITKIAFAG
jgi:hypothetical protein